MMPVKYFAQQWAYSEDRFMGIDIVVGTDICVFQRMCLVTTYIHSLGICSIFARSSSRHGIKMNKIKFFSCRNLRLLGRGSHVYR